MDMSLPTFMPPFQWNPPWRISLITIVLHLLLQAVLSRKMLTRSNYCQLLLCQLGWEHYRWSPIPAEAHRLWQCSLYGTREAFQYFLWHTWVLFTRGVARQQVQCLTLHLYTLSLPLSLSLSLSLSLFLTFLLYFRLFSSHWWSKSL